MAIAPVTIKAMQSTMNVLQPILIFNVRFVWNRIKNLKEKYKENVFGRYFDRFGLRIVMRPLPVGIG